jgi:hypothetical protein
MTTHLQRVDDLTRVYALLVGKRYDELTNEQLRVLLANEYWKDGMDIEQVFSEMLYRKTDASDAMPIEMVQAQLTRVFGYEPSTVIPE